MKKKVTILITSIIGVVGAVVGLVLGLTLTKPSGGKGPTPPTAIYHNDFTVEKTIEGQTKTVSLGGEIVYNINITNNSEKGLKIEITDTLPTNTTYVSGGELKGNSTVSWDLIVDGNDSRVVSYIVKVDEDLLIGSQIVSTTVQAGEKTDGCENMYVANTLNNVDRIYMAAGIRTLAYSETLDSLSILGQMYQHAFSLSPNFSGEPKIVLDKVFETTKTADGNYFRQMAIPTLYGGVSVSEALNANFVGDREVLKKNDLIEGDVLFVEHNGNTKVYIFNGSDLILLDNGYKEVDTDEIIASIPTASRYVAMRPSINLTKAHYNAAMEITEDMTVAQKVVLATVQAYMNRGFRLQYDDSRLNYPYKTSTDQGEYRWQIGQYNPEDYTTQKWGYTNSAAFAYDVYKTALGIDLGDLYTIETLVKHYTDGGASGISMYPYYGQPNLAVSDTEKANMKTQFTQTLEIGDLIIVQRSDSTGHVLMYVGNNMAVNSAGASCEYSDNEAYESSLRYINLDEYLFETTSSNYIFRTDGYITKLCVVRPMDRHNGVIPENALNRLNNLDIFAEKLSSHPEGKTVNSGDDVTFNLSITNFGDEAKTLTITDVVPTNSIFKSASHNASVEGNSITWSVTVEAGETVVVSYVVTASGEDGAYIYGTDTKIGGVAYTCPKIYIKNTLTIAQQEAIRTAALSFMESNPNSLTKLGLVSAIYKQAGLQDPFESVTEAQLRSSLISARTSGLAHGSNLFELNPSSQYKNMLVDTLYGGRNFFTSQQYKTNSKVNSNRSRLPRQHSLTVGDILITKFSSSENCYLYIGGDKFLVLNTADVVEDTMDIGTRLMRMLSARHYYCVLRPSQMMTQV